MLRGKKVFVIFQFICLAIFSFNTAYGAGELDSGFPASAYGGFSFNGNVNVVKTQTDGKILVGGFFTEANGIAATAIARFNSDGTTDTSFRSPDFFNNQGLGREIWAIALQADGKIIVGGNIIGADDVLKIGLVRLNADGSMDTSFNNFNLPTGSIVNDIEIQPDNKILVGGLVCGVLRLNSDGSFDNSFTQSLNGNNSSATVEDLDLQTDGKVVVVTRNAMVRVTSTGALDSGFNQSNVFSLGNNTTVKVRADGKILVGGSFQTVNSVSLRSLCLFNSDGSVDSSFNASGPDGTVNDILLKPDGKILIGGGFNNYNGTQRLRIAQINSDGSLDTSIQFNVPGASGVVNDLELLADGKLLVGLPNGNSTFIRFNADGTIDSSFMPLLSRDGTVTKILQQPDGKVLVAGEFIYANGLPRNSLARFNSDGSLDTSFAPVNSFAASFALQPDGKIIVGGNTTIRRLNSDGTVDAGFAVQSLTLIYDIVMLPGGKFLVSGGSSVNVGIVRRFNSDGSVDATFNAPVINQLVYKLLVQPDGKVIIGGDFTTPGSKIARLNADGSLDNTFTGSANGLVYALDLQADGKIVVGGQFTALSGNTNQISIGRLNADGTSDTSFAQSTNSVVRTVKVQPDGKILIGGTMSAVQGAPHNGLARLNPNGSIDSSFNTFANAAVRDINLQSDGKILLGGAFSKINRLSAVKIARLLPSAPTRSLFDYDGDGRADVSVFRPSENKWFIYRSSDNQITQQIFAVSGDISVPADYDGDGKTDIGIFRPSTGDWWYQSSINNQQIQNHWGANGDIPRPSDFDGDGKADFIIFRPAENNWYRFGTTAGVSVVNFGLAGDKPVSGDFDGDGKSDVAIYRPSTGDWWYRSSINGAQLATRWGISTDIPAPADYDGDGKTDFAVYRPSTGVWYVINSSNGSFTIMSFGLAEDKPVPADYDGDGKADIAVFRPSTGIWYQMRSTAGFNALQWGTAGDIPTPNAFVP